MVSVHQNPAIHLDLNELLDLSSLAKDYSISGNTKSSSSMEGPSPSSARGRGMEFAEVRPYQVGDDIRHIDWRVTARTQTTYTKLFQEEKERPVFLLVDQRASMYFGSDGVFKSVLAAKLAGLIGWCAIQNGDRIGSLVFSESEQSDSRAKQGKHAQLRLLHSLIEFNHRLDAPYASVGEQSQNDLNSMLRELRRVVRPGSAVFILSDFYDLTEECSESFSALAKHADLSIVHIYDQLERSLPSNTQLPLTDGRVRRLVTTSSSKNNQAFEQAFESRYSRLKSMCGKKARCYQARTNQGTSECADTVLSSKRKSKRGR